MRANQLTHLVLAGGQDRARQVLKKLSLSERLPLLRDMIPNARVNLTMRAFLREHFLIESYALAKSNWDVVAAEKFYNNLKNWAYKNKKTTP